MPKIYLFVLLFLTHCKFFVKRPPPFIIWPLEKYRVSQAYAPKWNYYHQGIDLVANKGTPVLSSHSGRVVYAGQRLSGYGKVVVVEYSEYWSSLYAHLESLKVKNGQTVRQGQVLGTVGNTGKARGVHLHFELIYKKQPVNPLNYLP